MNVMVYNLSNGLFLVIKKQTYWLGSAYNELTDPNQYVLFLDFMVRVSRLCTIPTVDTKQNLLTLNNNKLFQG